VHKKEMKRKAKKAKKNNPTSLEKSGAWDLEWMHEYQTAERYVILGSK
jgi:hypothetical protein